MLFLVYIDCFLTHGDFGYFGVSDIVGFMVWGEMVGCIIAICLELLLML